MSKLISTVKGLFYCAVEQSEERVSHATLKEQIRVSGLQVRQARKAVAVAKAQQGQDKRRLEKAISDIADLEARGRKALEQGEDKLAHDAAVAIAILEDERDALKRTVTAFEKDLAVLVQNLRKAELRFRNLERGQRVASVKKSVQSASTVFDASTLTEAEETLARINDQQERDALTEEAYDSLSIVERPDDLVTRLSEAGCGAPVNASVDSILDRLKAEPKS